MQWIFYFHASAELYGSDYVLLELIRKVATQYKVVVFLPKDGPLVAELKACNAKVVILDLAVLRREHLSMSGVFSFFVKLVGSAITVYRYGWDKDIKAIHTNTAAVWTGFLAAKLVRKRHVWQVMEIIEKPKPVSWVMSRIVGMFSSRVFCISEAVRQHFLKCNGGKESKFVTLYHGVDRKVYDVNNIDRQRMRSRLKLSDDVLLIGYAGRFNAWKGQEVFAAAAEILLERYPVEGKVHFLFMGSVYGDQNSYEEELKAFIDSSNRLKASSTVVGFQTDFQDWLGAMGVVVLPSKLPEPNATITVAAMTLGIPVVGTNIGGTVESVVDGETGYLVPPNDPQKLAEKIYELVESASRREAFGKRSIERANKMFSIDHYVGTILECYGDTSA